MKYVCKLILRIILIVLIAIFNLELFYFLFSKLTFYLTYLSLFFYDIFIKENMFIVNNTVLEFIPACVAGSAYFLLTLLILLTKNINLKKSIKLFLIGSLLILIANIIRLDILVFILINYGNNLFNTLHLFFWKVVSSVYVAFVWIFLVYKFKVKEIPIYSDIIELRKSLKIRKSK